MIKKNIYIFKRKILDYGFKLKLGFNPGLAFFPSTEGIINLNEYVVSKY